MSQIRNNWKIFLKEAVKKIYVHGYIKPEAAFHTLDEWENLFVNKILDFQKKGHYVSHSHGKVVGPQELQDLIQDFYGFQLNVDVDRYDLLTSKNILDHIEDFANHRYWSLQSEFQQYFDNIDDLRFAYFYSRGDLEPYVLVDDAFTEQIYGSLNNPKTLYHYTHQEGVERIQRAIQGGDPFDISAYTVAERDFFRQKSNLIIEFEGNVRAGFRSDVKSYSVSNGRKCVNLHRMGYPGDKNNLCLDLENDCNGELKTSLWNEFIVTPMKILDVYKR
ncbi:MAG TPA: hypothetical protein DF712_09390 [Balneola sp.]|nr:hypothetical protein [Balneola sp.]|tara:strand:+ start:3258 stop:4085 length:828 start_codon:yes stop_codon:yes gene_type:complete